MSSKQDVHGHDTELHADDGLVHVHVHPASTYWKIFFALVFFTLVTVGLSKIHLGEWNFLIAVAVATIKATLVATFFMHLKDDNRFNVLIFVGSLLFMGVFFIYTMNDTQHRGQWDESYGTKYAPATGEVAPGRGHFETIRLDPHAAHGGDAHGAADTHGQAQGHPSPVENAASPKNGADAPAGEGTPARTGEPEGTVAPAVLGTPPSH